MAPVIQALDAEALIKSRICVTAQHREMLDQVLHLFGIHPHIDLNLMRPNQTLSGLTAQILVNIDTVLESEKPDWIIVQGDTTTVMASALAAFYRGIKVGHVEAGLRTGDKLQPFPEEINRRLTSSLADLHFAPTILSQQNLIEEGIDAKNIVVTGNPVIDALQQITKMPPPSEILDLAKQWGLSKGDKRLVLVTAHRRENFGQPIKNICTALKGLAEHYGDQLVIVYPVHLNPNIQEPVRQLLGNVPNIFLVEPLEYLPLVHILKQAYVVLTDSGGIQEEATGLEKPTLVLRNKTERPEGVEAGVLRLVGTNSEKIFIETCRLLDDEVEYGSMSHASNPFGDGHAAKRIVQALLAY